MSDMITIEKRVTQVEEHVEALHNELQVCGIEKDVKINAMHQDMGTMHKDFNKLEHTVGQLTGEVTKAVEALSVIAFNTSTMKEMAQVYEKVKGFTWVVSKAGFWGAIFVAFVAGVVAAFVKIHA